MREVADAGAIQRRETITADGNVKRTGYSPAAPRPHEPPSGMMYFRGALVKRK